MSVVELLVQKTYRVIAVITNPSCPPLMPDQVLSGQIQVFLFVLLSEMLVSLSKGLISFSRCAVMLIDLVQRALVLCSAST